MLDTKRQLAVTKEAPQDRGMPRDASALTPNMSADVVDGIGRQVREPTVLEIAPQQLHRVELGRVGRQAHDMPGAMSGQPSGDEAMPVGEPAIPDEDDRTRDVTGQMLEKPPHLRSANVLPRIERERQGDPTAVGEADDQEADDEAIRSEADRGIDVIERNRDRFSMWGLVVASLAAVAAMWTRAPALE